MLLLEISYNPFLIQSKVSHKLIGKMLSVCTQHYLPGYRFIGKTACPGTVKLNVTKNSSM